MRTEEIPWRESWDKNEVCLVLIDGQSASHFTAWIIIPNRDCLAPFMYPLSRFFHPLPSFFSSLRRFPRLYPSFALYPLQNSQNPLRSCVSCGSPELCKFLWKFGQQDFVVVLFSIKILPEYVLFVKFPFSFSRSKSEYFSEFFSFYLPKFFFVPLIFDLFLQYDVKYKLWFLLCSLL